MNRDLGRAEVERCACKEGRGAYQHDPRNDGKPHSAIFSKTLTRLTPSKNGRPFLLIIPPCYRVCRCHGSRLRTAVSSLPQFLSLPTAARGRDEGPGQGDVDWTRRPIQALMQAPTDNTF